MPSPGSLFDSKELARWRSSSRPLTREPSPRVTVVCSCGVLMEVTWAHASVVRCFGCERAFAPPPGIGPRAQWKPELAPDPVALPVVPLLAPPPPPRRRALVRRVLVPALIGLVGIWLIQTAARLGHGSAAVEPSSDLPLQTEPRSDDR